MEKQVLIIKSDLKTIGYMYISGLIQRVDIVVFKIVIDYIVRNFDPTGINIGGLIDSFCYVLIKPKLSSFIKMLKGGINHYSDLAINLRKLSPDGKFIFYRSFMLRQGCLK